MSDQLNKHNLLGVGVNAITYDQANDRVIERAKSRKHLTVSHLAVHGLVTGSRDPQFRSILNDLDIVAPDGQPVRLALNILYRTSLPDRCYGPEFMLRLCRSAAQKGVSVYLYGSTSKVVSSLKTNLLGLFPALTVAGCEPSLFRPLTADEDAAFVRRVNDSGAGILFIGLGCPLQEKFAHEHRGKIEAVMVCNGAAFDFHSGNKKMAPEWMQRCALEWLFRLCQEPGRLWHRYFTTNSLFLLNMFLQTSGIKKF